MILLLTSMVSAEPLYTKVEAGECVLWNGTLLNDEAMKKLVVEHQTSQMTCDVRIDFEVNKTKINEKYKYDLLAAQYKAETTKLNEILKIRDEQIKEMKPRDEILIIAGGFVIGAATAIGIMYAVKPGLTQ